MRAAPDTSHEPAGGTERSLTTAGVLAFASALGFVIYQLAVQTSYTAFRDSIEAELAISLVQSGRISRRRSAGGRRRRGSPPARSPSR
ncbi:MAG: hypothetical protein FJ257_09450 [Phycisphaerae bacterium]|nr:hypothetical protein [Phycisphaerae bacterium]